MAWSLARKPLFREVPVSLKSDVKSAKRLSSGHPSESRETEASRPSKRCKQSDPWLREGPPPQLQGGLPSLSSAEWFSSGASSLSEDTIKVRGGGFEPGFNLGSNFSFLLLEFKPGFNLGSNFWKSSSCSRVRRTQC